MRSVDAALVARLRTRLVDVDRDAEGRYDDAALAATVRAELPSIGANELFEITQRLAAELTGAGPLEPLLHEPGVTDVLVNGPGQVWVDRGDGPQPSGVEIADEAQARRLAVRLVAAAGGRLDDASPYADGRLPDGTRIHAVLPPLSGQGSCLSLRVPARRGFTLDELVRARSLPAPGAALLRALVRSRLAFLVTGGTGSGKTTILSSLLTCCRPDERVVLVEDCAELRPELPHVIRLTARQPNYEGAGGVSLQVLVRQALRMRPDRLVVGEVRGAEVLDLLAALNTGHDGGCGTVHANRAEQLPARMESLCVLAGVPREAAHSLLRAAVDAVVHLGRGGDGRRRVAGVWVLDRDPGAAFAAVRCAYRFGDDAMLPGPAADDLDTWIAQRAVGGLTEPEAVA